MAKIKRHRDKGSKKLLDNAKAQRGLDRKAHFENGGELSRWRGLHTVEADRKKKLNKKACRGRISY